MYNWFIENKKDYITKLNNEVYEELSYLLPNVGENETTANHWLDERHNVFAYIENNSEDEETGCEDKWIVVAMELYDVDDNCVGEIVHYETEECNEDELRKVIYLIINQYLGCFYYADKN